MKERLRDCLGLAQEASGPALRVGTDEAVAHLTRYLAGGYMGGAFETYGTNDPTAISGDDLLAVTMLSIHIRPHSKAAISPTGILRLETSSKQIELLLTELPTDRDLHTLDDVEFDAWLGPGSAGDALYSVVRRQAHLPRVATHKVLARKRPRLMPIRDTIVEEALGMSTTPAWWRPWWETVHSDEEIVARLGTIRHLAGARHLSLLRAADIVVWMNGMSTQPPGTLTGSIDDTSGEP